MSKQISNHAAAAKAIRQELKKHGIKGRVRAEGFSGGSSVTVKLKNELPATVDAVKAFAGQYKYGHFDGMTDMYEYSNSRSDLPQVKFVSVENHWDDEVKADAWNYVKGYFADMSDTDRPENHEDYVALSRVMNGEVGNWLQSRKPRALAA